MFDLTSSKLLILGLVALIVVGPKDLPILLRTIGKYVGMLRRHANEFRAQFDEAMRDTELASLKAELDAVKRDVSASVSDAHKGLEAHLNEASGEIENQIKPPGSATAYPATTLPLEPIEAPGAHSSNGSGDHTTSPELPPVAVQHDDAATAKSGV